MTEYSSILEKTTDDIFNDDNNVAQIVSDVVSSMTSEIVRIDDEKIFESLINDYSRLTCNETFNISTDETKEEESYHDLLNTYNILFEENKFLQIKHKEKEIMYEEQVTKLNLINETLIDDLKQIEKLHEKQINTLEAANKTIQADLDQRKDKFDTKVNSLIIENNALKEEKNRLAEENQWLRDELVKQKNKAKIRKQKNKQDEYGSLNEKLILQQKQISKHRKMHLRLKKQMFYELAPSDQA